jgi:hypothetical protein
MFWTGIWLAGVSSLGANITAWFAATLGYVSIYFIMKDGAERLEKKQEQK